MKKLFFLLVLAAGFFLIPKPEKKVYWFIPDGMRAEQNLFNVYRWAKEGKLPNIKRMMDQGSYGYAKPNFPSHTPTNFATLLTGAYPEKHGVDDGPMHTEGKPLDRVAIGGFSSVAKKIPPIWVTLENVGKTVALLSIPGSTPPELKKGYTFRGRWGGWGADFHALNFETKGNLQQRILQGRGTHLFFFGPELTRYADPIAATGWPEDTKSYSPSLEIVLDGWGAKVFGLLTDSTDDRTVNYDHVSLSTDKKTISAVLRQGEQSSWLPVTLMWQNGDQKTPVDTQFIATVIKLDPNGFYRIRLFYNTLNKYNTEPPDAAGKLLGETGPMVDFVDNYPAQLIYYPEDKNAFLKEAWASLDWHKKAVKPLMKKFDSQVIIHDTYTPNQMLTSRWWMGSVDPSSLRYSSISEEERTILWNEVQEMYKKLDDIIGEILDNADQNTYVVLSSDHGAVPLDRSVLLNNYFAKKGWLTFTINAQNGEPIIDWAKTKVIYLKMAHVYVNSDGLAGEYHRASGPAYEALRNEVIKALEDLDDNGVKPVVDIVTWEDAQQYMQLMPDRVGDLVIANRPGYGWNEEMTSDLNIFDQPLISGYKQAIKSDDVPGMWTPFVIMGPGIKRNNFLGDVPFPLVDQYPTIMEALDQKIPDFVQGKPLDVFQK